MLFFISCAQNQVRKSPLQLESKKDCLNNKKSNRLESLKSRDSTLHKLQENLKYISQFLIHKKESYLRIYLKEYLKDSNCLKCYSSREINREWQGIKGLGYLHHGPTKDSVIIISEINSCLGEGIYAFTNPSLPFLTNGSDCLLLENIFSVGDMDEDGIDELGVYESSCVSRFKSLAVYSLKNRHWKEVGRCAFDIYQEWPDKRNRIRKLKKGEFQMLEVLDNFPNKRLPVIRKWLKFSF